MATTHKIRYGGKIVSLRELASEVVEKGSRVAEVWGLNSAAIAADNAMDELVEAVDALEATSPPLTAGPGTNRGNGGRDDDN